jgi:hypothetical protein
MHPSNVLHDDGVTLTWCACEHCSSIGPRFMTLVKNHHEYTIELDSRCCNPGAEDALLSDEAEHYNGRHPLRNQIPR